MEAATVVALQEKVVIDHMDASTTDSKATRTKLALIANVSKRTIEKSECLSRFLGQSDDISAISDPILGIYFHSLLAAIRFSVSSLVRATRFGLQPGLYSEFSNSTTF